MKISTCVGLQALAKMNTKFSKGLRYTSVGGIMCGRSEMIMPIGVGNLQKGKKYDFKKDNQNSIDIRHRYANMDYLAASVIQLFAVLIILISYDIACQWFVNLYKRMDKHWPADLKVPPSIKLIPAIPKLHEPMHGRKNHQMYSLNFITLFHPTIYPFCAMHCPSACRIS